MLASVDHIYNVWASHRGRQRIRSQHQGYNSIVELIERIKKAATDRGGGGDVAGLLNSFSFLGLSLALNNEVQLWGAARRVSPGDPDSTAAPLSGGRILSGRCWGRRETERHRGAPERELPPRESACGLVNLGVVLYYGESGLGSPDEKSEVEGPHVCEERFRRKSLARLLYPEDLGLG
jgi:hypothetical protein